MAKSMIEFKKFEEITKQDGWRFRRNPPIGQQWYYDNGFCTNSRGEGFRIHKGTKREDINRLINALNRRDVDIATLSTNLPLEMDKENDKITD